MTFTTKPDYWSILGLNPGSDLKEIKSAFRTEARRWHPDLNDNDSNAEERFKLINEAYAVLSDPQKRNLWESTFVEDSEDLFAHGFPSYNEYLEAVLGIRSEINDHFNQEDNAPLNNINYKEEDLKVEEEYLDEKPTHSPYSPAPVRQVTDLETLVELTPNEAVEGTTIEIELENGTRVEFDTPCFAGDGWRLRLPGVVQGERDHFIQLKVQTEEGLRIDGLRVLYKLELFPHDAVFGCAVEIPTLDGPVVLQVPPKSSSGRLLRLRDRGLQFGESIGDQIVEIVVVLPLDLTDAELALYGRLQELNNGIN